MPQPHPLSLRKKLSFGLLTTVLAYGLLEVVLWGCGVPTIEAVRDPFVGFEPGVPLFVRSGDDFVTNPLRTANFNVQRFPVSKPAGTLRIFCLGGSTTYGHPYDARVAYPHCLEKRLSLLAPDRQFEVVNCGGVSYASYRLAIVMDEIVAYQPDIVVVHTGHNEFLEQRTYGDVRDRPTWAKRLVGIGTRLRTVAVMSRCLDACRATPPPSELTADVMTILEQPNGPQSYRRDDELHRQGLRHLEFSLRRMHATARGVRASVIVVKPASDLRGMSPFKSESSIPPATSAKHQALLKQAAAELQAGNVERRRKLLASAAKLDPRHAEGQWLHGQSLLDAGNDSAARQAFVAARDEDVCPLRATSDIEMLIERVAHETASPLVNLSEFLDAACQEQLGHRCVGPESFLDHVHLTPARHMDLAVMLSDSLVKMGVLKSSNLGPQADQRWRDQLAAEVSPLERAFALHTLSMTLGWTGKNQEAQRLSLQAVEMAPREARVQTQLGRLQEKLGDLPSALKTYQTAVDLDWENPLALFRLGSLLLEMGRPQEARATLIRAAKCTPVNAPESFRAGVMQRLRQCPP